jgi:predicted amidohydrolase
MGHDVTRPVPLALCAVLLLIGPLALASMVRAEEETPMSAQPSSHNLIGNPSFEKLAGDLPDGWDFHAPRDDIAPSVATDESTVRSGQRSFCMAGAGKRGVIGWISTRCPGVKPGETFKLAAYFRVEDVPDLHESVWMRVTWLRSSPADGTHRNRAALAHKLTQSDGWWRISGVFTAPKEAEIAVVSLGLRYAEHGKIWWDDVSMRRVPTPSPRPVRVATAFLPYGQRAPEDWARVLAEAGGGNADIVCLGELAEIVAPHSHPRPTIPGPASDTLAEYARRYHMMVVVSLPEWDEGLQYNTAIIMGRDGEILGRYRKTHLPQAEAEGGTAPGDSFPVFDTEIGRIGLQICYDHFFPEVARLLALGGAEMIFTPIMGDLRADETVYDAVARARAVDNSVFYVTSIRDTGRSLVVDPSGRILADTAGIPGVAFADVDLNAAYYEDWMSVGGDAEFRHLWPKERRPALYRALSRPIGVGEEE